jgi:hypothetical protein
MAAMAVVVNDGSGGIELAAPMAALSTVAAVNDSSDDGIFTTTSYNNNKHPCPHYPHPCLPLDKEGTVGWRACRGASHLLTPRKSMVACSSCLGVHRACGYHNE